MTLREIPVATAPPNPPRIALVVDDEPGVRMCTADVLLDMGYEVVETGSAEEALSELDRGLRPTLVVTDHLMPGMSGADLAREVVGRNPGTPVIVVSGYTNVELDPSLVRLSKPFRLSDLRECVVAATAARDS